MSPSDDRTVTATGHNDNIVEEPRLATPIDKKDQEENRPTLRAEADAIVDTYATEEHEQKLDSATLSRDDSMTVVRGR